MRPNITMVDIMDPVVPAGAWRTGREVSRVFMSAFLKETELSKGTTEGGLGQSVEKDGEWVNSE